MFQHLGGTGLEGTNTCFSPRMRTVRIRRTKKGDRGNAKRPGDLYRPGIPSDDPFRRADQFNQFENVGRGSEKNPVGSR